MNKKIFNLITKNKLLLFVSLPLSVFMLGLLFVNPTNLHFSPSFTAQSALKNDTLLARQQMQRGNAIQYSNPDSATNYYNKAIVLLNPYQKETTRLMLAQCYIRLASINNYSGNYTIATKYDSLAMEIGLALKSKNVMAQSFNIKGLIFFNQSNYPAAFENYEKALALAIEAGNKKLEAMIYTNSAIIYYYKGELDKAESYFSKTMAIALEIGDGLLLSGSYINIGLVAQNAGKQKIAIDNYQKAADLCAKIGDKNGVILCYQNIGSLWVSIAEYPQALEALMKSLHLAQEMKDQPNVAKADHNIGEVYAGMGDFETAIKYYIQSAQLREELNDQQGLAICYCSIGDLNYQKGEYRFALKYYQKALDINKKLEYQQGIAKNYSNLGNIYLQTSQWDKALEFALKALELYQHINYDQGIAEIYTIIGSIYSGKQQYQNAEKYLQWSLQKNKETGNEAGMSTSMNQLSHLMLQMAEKSPKNNKTVYYAKAIQYGTTALKLSKEKNVLPVQLQSALLLKNAYSKSGEFKKAYEFSEESRIISDSLLNKAKAMSLTLAEAKWNAERNQRKIDDLEHEKILKDNVIRQKEEESSLKNTIIYLMAAISLLLTAIGVSIILYIRKRRIELEQKQLSNIASLRMQNIRNRMSPHFFFNMLNTVSENIGDPGAFKKDMGNLALLLRKSLENIEQTAIPVEEELRIVKAFVDLQAKRIPGPLDVNIKSPGNDALQWLVPAMIIQIPVENAIKHGLMPLQGEKKLDISVEDNSEGLLITIKDNGIGLTHSAGRSSGTGTGLKVLLQTISFLNNRNKNKIQFNIEGNYNADSLQEGTTVVISIPFDFSFNYKTNQWTTIKK